MNFEYTLYNEDFINHTYGFN